MAVLQLFWLKNNSISRDTLYVHDTSINPYLTFLSFHVSVPGLKLRSFSFVSSVFTSWAFLLVLRLIVKDACQFLSIVTDSHSSPSFPLFLCEKLHAWMTNISKIVCYVSEKQDVFLIFFSITSYFLSYEYLILRNLLVDTWTFRSPHSFKNFSVSLSNEIV